MTQVQKSKHDKSKHDKHMSKTSVLRWVIEKHAAHVKDFVLMLNNVVTLSYTPTSLLLILFKCFCSSFSLLSIFGLDFVFDEVHMLYMIDTLMDTKVY
jgi:hypothetical protein